jgi:protein-S-isoprenylcysteine O-methyltransferase Ste14
MLWLRTALFALVVVAPELALGPWLAAGGREAGRGAASPWRWLGLLPLALGVLLMLRCWADFVRRGRGTPAPVAPTEELVVAGPYRWVRNPMYVAGLLIIGGQAALYAEPRLLAYAAAFWAATHAFVVGYEERALRRRFGAAYDAYRARVPRWVPRPPRA